MFENAVLLLLFFLLGVAPAAWTLYYFSSLLVADGNSDDLNILWYLFSLTLVITIIVIVWVIPTGVFAHIEFLGRPTDEKGKLLYALGDALTDFGVELKLLFAAVLVVLIPQALAYVACALNGCASRVRFVDACTSFVFWGVVKFFSVAAGYSVARVFSAVVFDGIAPGRLASASWYGKILDLCGGLYLMLICVALALGYTRGRRLFDRVSGACPPLVRAAASRFHVFATRNLK